MTHGHKIPANGFIGFITAQGFFVGLIFGVLKFDDPIALLIAALVVTGAFYMFGQISVSYFVRSIDVKMGSFPKVEHEILLDEYAHAIQKREDILNEVEGISTKKKGVDPVIVERENETGGQ